MAIGSVRQIIVCIPDNPLTYTAQCGQGKVPGSMQAYVIDASQAASFEASNGPFDYAIASAIWGMAFTFVVGLYLSAKAAGVVLNRIKS